MSSDVDRTEFRDDRKFQMEQEARSAEQFDRGILTLAGSALGLTITFIRDIVPASGDRRFTEFVAIGWGCLLASICATLASLITSQRVHHCNVEQLDQRYATGEECGVNKWLGYTTILNYISITSFCLGVLFLGSFVYINLK